MAIEIVDLPINSDFPQLFNSLPGRVSIKKTMRSQCVLYNSRNATSRLCDK